MESAILGAVCGVCDKDVSEETVRWPGVHSVLLKEDVMCVLTGTDAGVSSTLWPGGRRLCPLPVMVCWEDLRLSPCCPTLPRAFIPNLSLAVRLNKSLDTVRIGLGLPHTCPPGASEVGFCCARVIGEPSCALTTHLSTPLAGRSMQAGTVLGP